MSHRDEPVTDPHYRLIADHVRARVGPIANVFHPPGPDIVPVQVIHCAPEPKRPWHTFVTCGMSRRPMCAPAAAPDCRYAELFLCLPGPWRVGLPDPELKRMWPIHELGHLARLPHVNESWVWWGHTIGGEDPAERITPEAGFTAWIVGPHLSLGHDGCLVPFGKERILIMGALPIYPEELELARNWGSEALFDRMSAYRVTDRIDLRRRNCARGLIRRE